MRQYQTIVLASASASRRKILTDAGFAIQAVPAAIDEVAVRRTLAENHQAPGDLAVALANAKAADIAKDNPSLPVIGADQLLICGGARYDKVADMDQAHQQLMRLQGRSHELLSAVTLHQGENVLWSMCDTARLTMRSMSGSDVRRYLERAGPAVLGSVGCYQLEGKGSWLFEKIEGDFFTILGLPLLPLLETLRRLGIVS